MAAGLVRPSALSRAGPISAPPRPSARPHSIRVKANSTFSSLNTHSLHRNPGKQCLQDPGSVVQQRLVSTRFLAFSHSKRRFLGLGFAEGPTASSTYGKAEEPAAGADVEEQTRLPPFFKELSKPPVESPNYLFWAAALAAVVLMRASIVREVAHWVLWSSHLALVVAEALTVGLGAVINAAAVPIEVLVTFAGWAVMAAGDLYYFIVESTPVQPLLISVLLASAVLSVGDVTTARVKGLQPHWVRIAMVLGLAGVLEILPPGGVLLSLALLTVFLFLVQKADLVSGLMPATVTLVSISEPSLQALVFALFLALAVYANWKAPLRQEEEEEVVRPRKGRPPLLLIAATLAVGISLAARMLYARSLTWLLVR